MVVGNAVKGTKFTGSPTGGLILHLNNEGNRDGDAVYLAATDGRFTGVLGIGTDGQLIAGSRRLGDGTIGGWLVRMGADRKVKWQRDIAAGMKGTWDRPIAALAHHQDGTFALTRNVRLGYTYHGYFELRSVATGGVAMARKFESEAAFTFHGGMLHADGATYWLAGMRDNGGVTRHWYGRFTPWAHTGCNEAGGCFGKKAADCDDGKACTADTCTPGKGCVHVDLPPPATCTGG